MADVSYRFAGIPDGIVASVRATSDPDTEVTTVTGTQGGYGDVDLPVGDYVAIYHDLGNEYRVGGDLADPTDVDYARSGTGTGGTSVAPDSALIAYNSGDVHASASGRNFQWLMPGTNTGEDVTVNEDGDLLFNTAGRYTIVLDLQFSTDADAAGYVRVKADYSGGTSLPDVSLLSWGNDCQDIGPLLPSSGGVRKLVVIPEDAYDVGNVINLSLDPATITAGEATFADGTCMVYVRRVA